MARVVVRAELLVAHPPERVYELVADIGRHAQIMDRRLRFGGVDAERRGGRIVIAGPLGLRRVAHTAVTADQAPHRFGGVAAVGPRTLALAHWRIAPAPGGATVVLEATPLRLGALDRLLLALGGRRWLRDAFARVLENVGERLDCVDEAAAADAGARRAARAAHPGVLTPGGGTCRRVRAAQGAPVASAARSSIP